MDIPAFIINLPHREDRQKSAIENCSTAGFQNIQVVNAVWGVNERDVLVAQKEFGVKFEESRLKPNEKGCFLSHVKVWATIVTNKIPLAYIFEDDVCFVSNVAENLSSIVPKLPGQVPFMLFFGYWDPSTASLADVKTDFGKLNQVCSAHAYVISLEAAEKMISFVSSTNMSLPLDLYLFTRYDTISLFNTDKSIAHQNFSFQSDIQDAAFVKMKLDYYRSKNFPLK